MELTRRARRRSQASRRILTKRYGSDVRVVAKRRRHHSMADERTGPNEPHSTVL